MFTAFRFLITIAALASLGLLVLAVGSRIPAGDEGAGPLAAPALQAADMLGEVSATLSEQARNLDSGGASDMWRQIVFPPAKVVLAETGRVVGVLGQVIAPPAGASTPTPTPTPPPCCPPRE